MIFTFEAHKVNKEKLKTYLAEETIVEFNSAEECRIYFNTYDGQNLKNVEDMKAFQGPYGFGYNGKWYHINFDEALDVIEHKPLESVIQASTAKTQREKPSSRTNTVER